jgi:dolichol kinase
MQYKDSSVEGCCAMFAGGTAVTVVWTHYSGTSWKASIFISTAVRMSNLAEMQN